ncbi:MAG: transcriptional regulator [Candidatus Marinimicrobia bacterium CG_4_10_14_0_2_um_filter_48_9]|nr:MAG: transcriptional regulator [Candidatus Marinimicrobia bacterium CG_4_10_14_0_2_um_filter_48_9]
MAEHQNMEWKESWRDEYLKWICGFANAYGGILEIGRNDEGVPVVLSDARKLLEDLPNKIRDILGIVPDVHLIQEDGKDLIRIRVEPQLHPVSYKGQYHYRTGSTKQELKGAALDRFLLQKIGKHWDGVPIPHVGVSDLSSHTLETFRQLSHRSRRLPEAILEESDKSLIAKLHLMDGDYLKRAALLLFHPDPERFVTGAFIKMGYFEAKADLRYQDEVHGELLNQVNQTLDILKAKYLKAMISYEGIQRVETFPVPEEALREAILNAVAHKDYSSGAPIQISVYADKIMIWNSGQLPQGWSVDTMIEKHQSLPFNPDIAKVFSLAGMIEAWGRGIERIFAACNAANVPDPEFKYEPTGLWVTFPYSSEYLEANQKSSTQDTSQARLGEKLGEKLGENRQAIVHAIRIDQGVTLADLATIVGISQTAIENNIKWLKENGHIDRVGPAKGGHWVILDE